MSVHKVLDFEKELFYILMTLWTDTKWFKNNFAMFVTIEIEKN